MEANTKITFLDQISLFDVLSLEEKQRLAQVLEFRRIPKHDYIYQQNDYSDAIHFLAKGVVKIGAHSEDGREVIKSVLHPLALFGELSLVGEKRRGDFAAAMNEEVGVYSLKVGYLQRLMRENFKLSTRVIGLLGERLRRTESRLESLIFKDARARIIDFLVDAANKRGKRIGVDETLVKHSLTQQDIANITGTSRQTVTSVLNELKKMNLIHFNRRSILIRDMANLA